MVTPSAARCCAMVSAGRTAPAHAMIAATRERRVIKPPDAEETVYHEDPRDAKVHLRERPSQPYWYPVIAQMKLEYSDAGFGVVEDRRGERGVGPTGGEHLDEMIETAGAAGGDDRNRDGRLDGRHD